MHLDIPRFAKECYLRMSMPMLLTLAVGFGINHLIADAGWLSLIIKGGLVCVVYAIAVFFLGLGKSDRKAILGFAKRAKRKITK